MLTRTAVVDANVLVASADRSSEHHERCLEVLSDGDIELIIPALCVAEATYLIHRDLGVKAEVAFLRGLGQVEVLAPEGEDWERIGALVEKYADLRIGGTDASVVALAERLDTDLLMTLDRRHFQAIKPRHCAFFRLLPEL